MLEFGYITLTLLMSVILTYAYHYGLTKLNLDKAIVVKRTAYLAIGIMAWITYVFFISASGLLIPFQLPPRFPILLIFPVFIFTGIVLYRNKSSNMFAVIPSSWAVYYQSFRILIESLFVATVAAGFMHKEVTIEGYNFDMLYAFTAPVIGFLVFTLKKLPKKIALLWNYLGLAVIASIIAIFTTTMYFPQLWGSSVSLGPVEIVSFPFTLVASFLMPSAVFVHIFSIIQLTQEIRNAN